MAVDADPFNREFFRELRRSHGLLTDSQCARALGVKPSTIKRIQSGETSPSLRLANECRRVFGLEAFLELFPVESKTEATNARP